MPVRIATGVMPAALRRIGPQGRTPGACGGVERRHLDAAKELLEEFNQAKRRPGRLQAERVRFVDVAARYLVAYKTKRDGSPRPKSSLAKERLCLNIYILPVLGNARIGDLDLPDHGRHVGRAGIRR